MRKIFFLGLMMVLAACSAISADVDEKSMATASADLMRLGYAVQGEIMRGASPDSDLVALACGRDPSLCTPLAKYRLLVKREDGNAVLLLCTANQPRALLEDIACNSFMDARHWEKNVPCAFTLSSVGVCP